MNKHKTATGVVQWMMNNPWPSLIWHTFDYYLYPAGTYFAMKKSLESLHIQYSYKSKEVVVNNSLLKNYNNLIAKAAIYNIDGSLKYKKQTKVSVKEDAIARCFAIPAIQGLSSTYLLRLELTDAGGKQQSINWYWLSQNEEEMDWSKYSFVNTEQSKFADFSALQNLPTTTLHTTYSTSSNAIATTQKIKVTNTGKAVAFMVHLRVLKEVGGDDILPVFFDDNYFALAPGESRTIGCRYKNKDAGNKKAHIITTSWNASSE